MNCGWSEEHNPKHCQSQSNSTESTHMHKRPAGAIEEHNQTGAPEEGGEQQVSKPHKIWRRFPNTETAALKWIQTQFVSTATDTSRATRDPFDQPNIVSSTTLIGGGGTSFSTPTFNRKPIS